MNENIDKLYFENTAKYKGRSMPLLRRFGHALRAITYFPILVFNLNSLFGNSKSESKSNIQFLNDVSNSTEGYGLDLIGNFINFVKKNRTKVFDLKYAGIGKFKLPSGTEISRNDLYELIEVVEINGFAKIPNFLSEDQALNLYTLISNSKGHCRTSGEEFDRMFDWLPNINSGARFDSNLKLNSEILEKTQLLINNDFSQFVARSILGSTPLNSLPASWTTKPTGKLNSRELDEAAMAFHADADYFNFIKFFILLTDVEMDNGPFAYVRGSHKGKRHVAGRLTDDQVLASGGDVLYGTGKKGDLVIANTMGWHKATPPKLNHRMMLQILFTTSLFGSPT